jgi:serine protease Do
MPRNAAYKPLVTIARVAGLPDLPNDFIMITGGVFESEAAPVFDLNGRAIGLTASARTNSAFVPVEEFAYSLKDIPTGGRSRARPWLGIVRVTGLSKGDSQTHNLGTRTAARLSTITANGPARKAGIREMDYLVAIDGNPLRSYLNPDMIGQDVFSQMSRKKVGDVVELTVIRDGKEEKVPVTLEAMPMVAAEAPRIGVKELGLGLRDLVFADRFKLKLSDSQMGVILDAMPPNSPAAKDLEAGDVITAVNGAAVADVTSFGRLMAVAMADSSPYITMKVLRAGSADQAEEKVVRVRKG